MTEHQPEETPAAPSSEGTAIPEVAAAIAAIEARPLGERAAGYLQLHEQLRRRLEEQDPPPPRG